MNRLFLKHHTEYKYAWLHMKNEHTKKIKNKTKKKSRMIKSHDFECIIINKKAFFFLRAIRQIALQLQQNGCWELMLFLPSLCSCEREIYSLLHLGKLLSPSADSFSKKKKLPAVRSLKGMRLKAKLASTHLSIFSNGTLAKRFFNVVKG